MEALGFEVGQVAYRSGVSGAHIYRLLAGERPNASGKTVAQIAGALNTTTDYLLGRTNNPRPPDDNDAIPSTPLEWQLLDQFRELTEEQQEFALEALRLMIKHGQPKPPRIIGGPEEEKTE